MNLCSFTSFEHFLFLLANYFRLVLQNANNITEVCYFRQCSALSSPKTRSFLCSLFIAATLVAGAFFFAGSFFQRYTGWEVIRDVQSRNSNACKDRCRPSWRDSLPAGIVAASTDLEMRPLWAANTSNNDTGSSKNLLAIAVGIGQKDIVDKIVRKFLSSDFAVMLFHYDGVVDKWKDLIWTDSVIHVSSLNQTKWWFAKRFLHPDVVSRYDFIFLWDEDLGVENFDPKRYLSIVKEEGLEISQPALDPAKSKVHQSLTARNSRSKVHRRYFKLKGSGRCDYQSTAPPCVGWVEMMAPVFSRRAWRCAWYMIQNDLVHAWGLDRQLGYCAQGDRIKNVGVVDSEYIVHLGLPTLGTPEASESRNSMMAPSPSPQNAESANSEASAGAPSHSQKDGTRSKVRAQALADMLIFNERWKNAVEEDTCWIDPFL